MYVEEVRNNTIKDFEGQRKEEEEKEEKSISISLRPFWRRRLKKTSILEIAVNKFSISCIFKKDFRALCITLTNIKCAIIRKIT